MKLIFKIESYSILEIFSTKYNFEDLFLINFLN